jgi:hypothetical protein
MGPDVLPNDKRYGWIKIIRPIVIRKQNHLASTIQALSYMNDNKCHENNDVKHSDGKFTSR